MTVAAESRSIRRRRAMMWTAFALAAPVGAIDFLLRHGRREATIAAIVAISVGLVVALSLAFSRCPRCWMLFLWRRGVKFRFFRDECVHCGLRI